MRDLATLPRAEIFASTAPAAISSWFEECTVEAEEWLVDGIVPQRSYTGIFGKRGSAKSFFALDLACRGALGLPFLGQDAERFGTLYCVGEKKGRFGKRVQAWKQAHDVARVPAAVCFRWGCPNLLDEEAVSDFIAEVNALRPEFQRRGAPLGVLILDTLARCLKHANVSDADAAGSAVEAIQRIVDECGVTVIPLAHVAKSEGATTQKGAGEWEDAADALIRIDRKDQEPVRTVTLTKQSDEADGAAYAFELEVVEVGTSPKGRRVTSCVVREVDPPVNNAPGKRLSGSARIAAEALGYLIDNHLTRLAPSLPGLKPGTHAVLVEDWRERAGTMGLWEEGDSATNRRQKWHQAKVKVRDAGLVRIEGEWAIPLGALGGVTK